MEKFLILQSNGSNKIVSANNVILVETPLDSSTATTTTITYAGGKVVTITHAAQVAYSMLEYIQNGILAALATPWTHTGYVMPTAPQAISDIDVA